MRLVANKWLRVIHFYNLTKRYSDIIKAKKLQIYQERYENLLSQKIAAFWKKYIVYKGPSYEFRTDNGIRDAMALKTIFKRDQVET